MVMFAVQREGVAANGLRGVVLAYQDEEPTSNQGVFAPCDSEQLPRFLAAFIPQRRRYMHWQMLAVVAIFVVTLVLIIARPRAIS
ncbi:MAG: hypothetical protein NVSMB42_24290 [Herpetosiphon sp.]